MHRTSPNFVRQFKTCSILRKDMTEKKKRVSYTADFKVKVGLEAIRSDKTIHDIAQLYEIHPAQVSQWKKTILDQCKVVFEVKRGRKSASEHLDLDQLYSQIGKLKIELDWLKKKSSLS